MYTQPEEPPVNLPGRIKDLDRRITRLGTYIDDADIGSGDGQINLIDYTRLAALYGQLCSRLGRLMRDQQQLEGTGLGDLMNTLMDENLGKAGQILGVEL